LKPLHAKKEGFRLAQRGPRHTQKLPRSVKVRKNPKEMSWERPPVRVGPALENKSPGALYNATVPRFRESSKGEKNNPAAERWEGDQMGVPKKGKKCVEWVVRDN